MMAINLKERLMATHIFCGALLGISKIFALLALLSLTVNITGCACSMLGQEAWGGGSESCNKMRAADRDARDQKLDRELVVLKNRADAGDVKAQIAVGEFHVFGYHTNSDRATGLAYYDKAGRQGNLVAQYIFLEESYKDCVSKARRRGQKELDGPQYAPSCAAEWQALETLAAKACVRKALNIDSSVQYAVGKGFDIAGKSDEADFWFVVAISHCVTPAQRRASGDTDILKIGRAHV